MKRILTITVLMALVVAAAATPYWFGVEAERIYHHQLNTLESNNKITVLDNRFQRGWLRSYAESRVSVSINGNPIVVFAEHTIEHGPIPSSDPMKYVVSLRPLQALIRSQLSFHKVKRQGEILAVGTLLTTVNIDSSTRTKVNIPSADIQMGQSATLLWEQITGHVDFAPAESSWQGVLTTAGFAWEQALAEVQFGPSELSFHSYPGSTGLPLGDSNLATESIRARLPGSQRYLTATDLTIDQTAREQDQNVSYSMDGRMASADLIDLAVHTGDWHLEAVNLDLASLTRLNNMEVGAAIPLNDLVGLISKQGAKLESSFKFATDSGPFTADAKITLSDNGGSTNPLTVLSGLTGSLTVDMPPTVVDLMARSSLLNETAGTTVSDDAVAAKIQSWVDDDFLTRHGERYRLLATIKDGAVEVNNRPFNFMSLLR